MRRLKRSLKKILPKKFVVCIQRLRILMFYKRKNKEIASIMKLVQDDYSRDTLRAFINYRSTGNYKNLLELSRPSDKQYFDEQVFSLTDNESFVDMGVLDGSTSLQFVDKVNSKYSKIIMFEPDMSSYKTTLSNIKKHKLKDVLIFNEGCYDCNKVVYFTNNGSGNSKVSDEQTNFSINVVSLDNKIKEIKEINDITYIKMDIEGAESKALKGGIKTIREYKPKLAICIYHKLEDVYELPKMIKSILPEYKLYIRHYSTSDEIIKDLGINDYSYLDWELVCYAII